MLQVQLAVCQVMDELHGCNSFLLIWSFVGVESLMKFNAPAWTYGTILRKLKAGQAPLPIAISAAMYNVVLRLSMRVMSVFKIGSHHQVLLGLCMAAKWQVPFSRSCPHPYGYGM